MTVTYLDKNKISLKKLVMSVPWKPFNTEKWLKPNVNKIWEDFEKNWVNLLVSEIIVISPKDDEVVPFENWKKFTEKLNAKFIVLETWWHKLKGHQEFIVKIVKNWV